jgi:uncharacterized protein (DUF885 family)
MTRSPHALSLAHNEIVRLREHAGQMLGLKFAIASYNDAVVEAGGVPLALLQSVIDRYILSARG